MVKLPILLCTVFICAFALNGDNRSWAGTSSYYIWACNASTRAYHLDQMAAANLKVLRIYIIATGNAICDKVPDLEARKVGVFNDEILNRIDALMVDAFQRGIKLTITFHDRWSLGCWSIDAYVSEFKINATKCADSQYNNPAPFYNLPEARKAFQNRLAYALNHYNPYFRDYWKNLDKVIFSIEPENEPQWNSDPVNMYWLCEMAHFMKSIAPKLLISSGGAGYGYPAIPPATLASCPHVDIIAIHNYINTVSLGMNFLTAAWSCKQYKKRYILQEFGVPVWISDRDKAYEEWIRTAMSGEAPWLFWTLGDGDANYKVWVNDTIWTDVIIPLAAETSNSKLSIQRWPEIWN